MPWLTETLPCSVVVFLAKSTDTAFWLSLSTTRGLVRSAFSAQAEPAAAVKTAKASSRREEGRVMNMSAARKLHGILIA